MQKSSGFTLVELLIVMAIIGIIASIGLGGFYSSQAKARDAKRKANLSQIADALELYYNDKAKYPAAGTGANVGKIMGCGAGGTTVCTWGETAFSNTTTGTVYMTKLPTDPLPDRYKYYYKTASSNSKYQLYARLENENDKSILNPLPSLTCSITSDLCNYGVSSGNTTP